MSAPITGRHREVLQAVADGRVTVRYAPVTARRWYLDGTLVPAGISTALARGLAHAPTVHARKPEAPVTITSLGAAALSQTDGSLASPDMRHAYDPTGRLQTVPGAHGYRVGHRAFCPCGYETGWAGRATTAREDLRHHVIDNGGVPFTAATTPEEQR